MFLAWKIHGELQLRKAQRQLNGVDINTGCVARLVMVGERACVPVAE